MEGESPEEMIAQLQILRQYRPAEMISQIPRPVEMMRMAAEGEECRPTEMMRMTAEGEEQLVFVSEDLFVMLQLFILLIL
jgi:prefoldin subunit 5